MLIPAIRTLEQIRGELAAAREALTIADPARKRTLERLVRQMEASERVMLGPTVGWWPP